MTTHSREGHSLAADAATRLETERVEACPLCGSTATRPWRRDCRDWQQVDLTQRFAYDRCTRCSAHFLAERPIESELGRVYFAGYAPYQASTERTSGRPPAHAAARVAAPLHCALGVALGLPSRRRLARMLKWAYTSETPGETLLDYGCGAPTFLDDARRRGFATIGVDFSEPVLEVVRASGHEAHLVGEDFERNVPDGSVSCVRMNHVIEHLYHPRAALAAVRSKMRSGGRIHISTHNPGSIGSRVFGRRWHALDCPRHVVLYLPRVLRTMLAQCGFHDVSVVHEVGPKDLTRSWGIVLYDRGRIGHEQIAAMATDPVRSGVFWPLASLGAIIGVGDRYHAFARVP
jgi:2-polyprenyl-3-methyl-5-hydroxy-6-metoxy-1,4-benzoquinol methylase